MIYMEDFTMKKYFLLYLIFTLCCFVLPFGAYHLSSSIATSTNYATLFNTQSTSNEKIQGTPTPSEQNIQEPSQSQEIEQPSSVEAQINQNYNIDASTLEPFLIYEQSTGEILTVSVRDYLIGAVASEMPITWPDEALKAQAVASHSYVLFCKQNNDNSAIDGAYISADPNRRQGFMTNEVLQSYWGVDYEANYARLSALVDEVLAAVVLYEGELAATTYFAISNGKSEAGVNVWGQDVPYLVSVDSAEDKNADGFKQELNFSVEEMQAILQNNLGIDYTQTQPESYFKTATLTQAGYVQNIDVCGVLVGGVVVREALALRSHCFEITYNSEVFTVTTYGYGHGVGLSQWGAKFKAEAGQTWQEILAHYFVGTQIGKVGK